MLRYICKRLLQAIPMLLAITVICFLLINKAPYDAVDAITTPNMDQRTVEMMKEKYGLNDPVYVQYAKWLKNILKGEFGYSIVTHSDIKEDIFARIPNTITLILPSYLTAYVLSIVLGLIAGSNRNKWPDKIIDGFASLGLSLPSFWVAMLFMYFFGHKLGWFPIVGMHTVGVTTFSDFLRHYIMPFTVLVLAYMPDLIRYVRSSTIGQLNEDYVLVQRAYASTKNEILFKHVIKNVLLPIITKLGMALPMLVTGAIITESLFGWPGIGPYYVKAIKGLDYPVVMIILLMSGFLVIVGNLISDILYFVMDPRISR